MHCRSSPTGTDYSLQSLKPDVLTSTTGDPEVLQLWFDTTRGVKSRSLRVVLESGFSAFRSVDRCHTRVLFSAHVAATPGAALAGADVPG
jgi:hypothetical protein